LAPGEARWLLVEWDAGVEAFTHHTDSIDFDVVLEGSVEIGLDDGPHLLEAGDVVVVNGVDHSWRAGPAGCRLSVVSIGTPPP
jgi:quercetin dioxygenase-like cupin family protein